MADHVYTHLDEGLYFNPKCQLLWGKWVGNVKPSKLKSAGDYTSCELAYEIEESELLRNDSTVRTIARTDIVQKSGTLTITLRQLTDILKEAQYLSTSKAVVQAAAPSVTLELDNVEAGDIYEMGKLNIADVTIVEGVAPADIEYVENTHFKVDAPTGRIEILGLPDGATGDGVMIDCSAPAILAEAGRKEYAILAGEGITLRLVVRGLHPNGDDIVIPKVKFKVDGNLALGSDGTDYGDVTITGKIVSDITEPADRAMGYAISIPVAA